VRHICSRLSRFRLSTDATTRISVFHNLDSRIPPITNTMSVQESAGSPESITALDYIETQQQL
jgi:hypothetical protein